MGRLIDADKLLEETRIDRDYARKNGFLDMYYERQVLIDRIEAQPTAYDVDKLAEWLEDYKQIKMLIPIEQALKAEYNKALDDIVTIIKERVGMDWEWDFCFIEQIAEQLKEQK